MPFPWLTVGQLALKAGKYFIDRHDRNEEAKRAEAEARRAREAGDPRPGVTRRPD